MHHFFYAIPLLLCVIQPAFAQLSLLDRAQQLDTNDAPVLFDLRWSTDDIEAIASVDPTQPIGKRVIVWSPPASTWGKDIKSAVENLEAAPMEEFWCSDFLALVGPDAKLVSETDNEAVYAFSPQPTPEDDKIDRRFLSEMLAQLTIDKRSAQIQKFEMHNRRAFRPVFIAKVESFLLEAKCQPGPDGRHYIAHFETNLVAKIALKKVRERERREISGLRSPVRDQTEE